MTITKTTGPKPKVKYSIGNGGIDAHSQPRRTMNASQKWKPATVGVIVNQYKRIVTIHARKINARFEWQSQFYDHIIRKFQRIANYIVNNPVKWNDDKFFDGNT